MKLNKKKTIMLPVICLSAVALATVGFSTWIIGAQDATKSVSLSVSAGDVKDQRLSFEAYVSLTEEKPSAGDSVSLSFDSVTDSDGAITSSENKEKLSFNYYLKITATDTDDVNFTTDVTSILDKVTIQLDDDQSFSTLVTGSDTNTKYIEAPVDSFDAATDFIDFSTASGTPSSTVNYHDNSSYPKTTYNVSIQDDTIEVTGKIGFGWGAAFNYVNPAVAEASEFTSDKGTVSSDQVITNLKNFGTATSGKNYNLSLTFNLVVAE